MELKKIKLKTNESVYQVGDMSYIEEKFMRF